MPPQYAWPQRRAARTPPATPPERSLSPGKATSPKAVRSPRVRFGKQLELSAADLADVPPRIQELFKRTSALVNKQMDELRFQLEGLIGRKRLGGSCSLQDQEKLGVEALRRDVEAQRKKLALQWKACDKQMELADFQIAIMRNEVAGLRADVEVLKTAVAFSPELAELRHQPHDGRHACAGEPWVSKIAHSAGLEDDLGDDGDMANAVMMVRDLGHSDFRAEAPPSEEIQFVLHFDSDSGRSLGLDLSVYDAQSLVVREVLDGLVRQWNEQNPGQAVRPGDRIVAVNEASGSTRRLLEEVAQARSVCLSVLRGASCGVGGIEQSSRCSET